MPAYSERIRRRAKAAVVASIRAAQGYKRTRVLHETAPIVPTFDSCRQKRVMVTDPRYASPVSDKHCPRCSSLMMLRRNRSTGDRFYGCSAYPNCRGTRPYKGDDR